MKIFSFIDSMKKFSREMSDDDILVQYELNGEKQPLSFVNFEKRVMSFAALLNENGIKKGDNDLFSLQKNLPKYLQKLRHYLKRFQNLIYYLRIWLKEKWKQLKSTVKIL